MSVFNTCDKIIRMYLPTVMQSAGVFSDNVSRENTLKIWCNHFRKYNTGILKQEVEDAFRYLLQDQITQMYTPGQFEKVLKRRREIKPSQDKPKPLIKEDFKKLYAIFKEKCKERDNAKTYEDRKRAKKEMYDVCMKMLKWDTGIDVNPDLQDNFTNACFDDSYIDLALKRGVRKTGLL